MLLIFFQSVAKIVLQDFHESQLSTAHVPSFPAYQAWIENVPNPKYHFHSAMVFRYLLALLMYRQGIRERNSVVSLAGRVIAEELFFSTNMANYMEIHFRDLVTRLKEPPC